MLFSLESRSEEALLALACVFDTLGDVVGALLDTT